MLENQIVQEKRPLRVRAANTLKYSAQADTIRFSIVAAGQPMGLTTTSWCDVKHNSPCLCSMFSSMFSIVLVTKIPRGCVLSWCNFPAWKSSKRLVFYNHWNIRKNIKSRRGIDGFSLYTWLVAIQEIFLPHVILPRLQSWAKRSCV